VTARSVVVMHAACHGPSLTRAQVRKAGRLARQHGVQSIGWTEAYHRIGSLRLLLGFRLVIGPRAARKGRRGWAKDNPLSVRSSNVVLVSGAVQASPDLNTRVGPARGITYAVYQDRKTGLRVLHMAMHPDANVEGQPASLRRVKAYSGVMQVLAARVKALQATYTPDVTVVTGDLQWKSTHVAGQPAWAPPVVARALGLVHVHHESPLDWVLSDAPISQVRVIPEAENGQDHPWLIATLTPKENHR